MLDKLITYIQNKVYYGMFSVAPLENIKETDFVSWPCAIYTKEENDVTESDFFCRVVQEMEQNTIHGFTFKGLIDICEDNGCTMNASSCELSSAIFDMMLEYIPVHKRCHLNLLINTADNYMVRTLFSVPYNESVQPYYRVNPFLTVVVSQNIPVGTMLLYNPDDVVHEMHYLNWCGVHFFSHTIRYISDKSISMATNIGQG
jgi:hypothetical protein